MGNPEDLWLLHRLSETYGRRPSEVIGIDDEWAGYQLDVAALLMGSHVAAATATGVSAGEVLKRLRDGAKQVSGPPTRRSDKRTYQKLGRPGMPKMKIPESGIW